MDRRPVFPGQDGRGGRGMDRRNAPSGDRRMEGGLGGMDGMGGRQGGMGGRPRGMDGMGGRPGGMGARRSYPLSCEELLIVRVIPRN